MSRTNRHTVLRAYHKGELDDHPFHNYNAGNRYGNNRHMWADVKVKERRADKRSERSRAERDWE